MVRRFWVRDVDDVITGFADNDAAEVPDLHTAVLESVIRAVDPPGADGRIQSPGTWDGSAYTRPADVLTPFDPDTELGRKQIAATTLHQYLKSVTVGVHAIQHEKPQVDVQNVEQFIAMAHWGTYVAAHMGMLIDNFETWVTLMLEGPEHVLTAQEFYQSVHNIRCSNDSGTGVCVG